MDDVFGGDSSRLDQGGVAMALRQRLRSLLWRVPVEQEVREELAHHLELRTQELIAGGLNPADARRQARERMEKAHVEAELTRIGLARNRSWARREWMNEVRQDVSFAIRQCRMRPGFTLAAVLTLALGIGATTAIFSVVHAVVLKPHAYTDPDRVLVANSMWRGRRGSWSVGNFHYFRQRLQPASTCRTTATRSAWSAAA
jgi:putative ABC transport system permease protein